jgi:hypothetical protein
MSNMPRFSALTKAYQAFRWCIESMADDQYLTPVTNWSARDTAAHLVGWNRNMIEAGKEILRGETPSYYPEAKNDYKNVNAGFVVKYSTRDKAAMLAELASSMAEFEAFLNGLEPSELDNNHGVIHYSGDKATVARLVDSLTGDYEYHREEIEEWVKTRQMREP